MFCFTAARMPKGTPTVYRMMKRRQAELRRYRQRCPNDVRDVPLRAQGLAPVTPNDALVPGVPARTAAADVVSELDKKGAVQPVYLLEAGQNGRIVLVVRRRDDYGRKGVARAVVDEGERGLPARRTRPGRTAEFVELQKQTWQPPKKETTHPPRQCR